MIYFTTFIFTLLLSYIARATPTCGDVAYPEELFDPTYADAKTAQTALPIIVKNIYDDPNGDTSKVTCSEVFPFSPHFKDIPSFPYIGAASFIKRGSEYCGSCWELTNLMNHKTVFITFIDHASTGFDISDTAYDELGCPDSAVVELKRVNITFCVLK